MNTKLLAIIGMSTILAACTPPNPDTPNLEVSNIEITNEGSTNIFQEDPMQDQKTLEDFEQIEANTVTVTTTKGDIVFEIYADTVPVTAQNFLNLAQDGYFDGIVFHRVEPGFVVQFGDPQTKTPGTQALWGTGGPGYTIPDEFDPTLRHDSEGIVSMANRGP